jgi:hypothetical protein
MVLLSARADHKLSRPTRYSAHRLCAIREEIHDDLLQLHAIAVHQRQMIE